MTLFQGVAIIITEGFPITDLGRRFEWIGSARVWEIPVSVIVLLLVMLACHVLLRYLRVGRLAYAIGGNEYTTFLAGIPVRRYKILFYVISGFFAGLGSVVLASRISSAIPNMGADYTLQAIGAVVIGGVPLTGGRGNVWGTFTGVLLLGVIANGLNLLHVEASWQYVLTGAIIVIAVILHEQRSGK
jgi:ribose/xylose/arabinose/galactoside ABC-type transport system permease subunit